MMMLQFIDTHRFFLTIVSFVIDSVWDCSKLFQQNFMLLDQAENRTAESGETLVEKSLKGLPGMVIPLN